ncbi:hypothetical protein [Pseudaminobacter soli (ex Li et al. 2025)]|uniref:hypothetical protein n=1 Tax=Pseudaminobacter soli (ex Li et al. 2025) TaxID=1295366 RepID=UPI002473DD3B|nr:hypothetical protein [Mesorhizobium soli]
MTRRILINVAMIIGAWTAFYYGMLALKGLQDTSEPPAVVDYVSCERVRLNAQKISEGQKEFDTVAQRWTFDRCRALGYQVD